MLATPTQGMQPRPTDFLAEDAEAICVSVFRGTAW
jgi:hypothetical protein